MLIYVCLISFLLLVDGLLTFHLANFIYLLDYNGGRGSVVVCYKLEGRGFETR
jgi:hypothetical protein